MKKEFVRLKVEDLIPYEKNPRKIPQSAIDDVCESIRQCGALDPIEVDENNVILAGHTRRLAYMKAGIKEVDVIRYIGLTEAQKRKYRLLSNKTGEKSGWDYELLDWEIDDLDFEGYDFGFSVKIDEYPNEDELDADTNTNDKTVARLVFQTYKDYAKHEDEIKDLAERIGAAVTVGK